MPDLCDGAMRHYYFPPQRNQIYFALKIIKTRYDIAKTAPFSLSGFLRHVLYLTRRIEPVRNVIAQATSVRHPQLRAMPTRSPPRASVFVCANTQGAGR